MNGKKNQKSSQNNANDIHLILDMLNFLSGVQEDPRGELAKAQDYDAEEVVATEDVEWREKDPSEWRKLPIRDQNGSGMCVAQTTAKLLGIDNELEEQKYLNFSALDIYDQRNVKPLVGMYGVDALTIASKKGACLQEQLNDQRLTEAEANRPVVRTNEMIAAADKYRAGGFVQPKLNIDSIASFINKTKKGVMLLVSFEYEEWTDVPKVNKHVYRASNLHSVTAVDFTMWKGKKGIPIDDSWGKFNAWNGQRVLTEDFFNERVFFAGALLDLSNIREKQQPPKFTFTKILEYGQRNDDIKKLQEILKAEGFFPAKQECTGLFLNITARAVKAWQGKNGIMDFAKETDMRKIRVGPKTIKLLNKLYSL